MRSEEFGDRLYRGAAEVAAQAAPAAASTIRRRGDRRRHRAMLASGLLAFTIGAGSGGFAYASFTKADGGPAPAGGISSSSATSSAAGPASGGQPSIVGVTTAGVIGVLNPVTGVAMPLTGTQDAVGDEISVSPDGSTVYFAVRNGCADDIESVPLRGGTPRFVTTGVLPAISPDGGELAFVREQVGGGASPVSFACPGASTGTGTGTGAATGAGTGVSVVVRDLVTGAEKTYPAPPGQGALISAVSHLSWSPDGSTLLVSSGPVQDNEGWELNRLNVATATYYMPDNAQMKTVRDVPAATAQSPGSYFEEGVYLPDGDLFVDRTCCAGVPAKTVSSLLQEVSASGVVLRQVAVGYPDRLHSSLDAIPGWLLYLSGTDLFVAADGQPPKSFAVGYIAAAWVP
jgi:hypothetical protein